MTREIIIRRYVTRKIRVRETRYLGRRKGEIGKWNRSFLNYDKKEGSCSDKWRGNSVRSNENGECEKAELEKSPIKLPIVNTQCMHLLVTVGVPSNRNKK